MSQELILVDETDEVNGYGEKLHVHRTGQLHRAFSIFALNSQGQLLLQRRAFGKYHSGGLWTNTCCSHQVKGEDEFVTIHKRLQEEMGFDCALEPLFTFKYQADLDNNLTEHELDHVYLGQFDGQPKPNPDEVCEWKWVDLLDLQEDLGNNPALYTYWLNYVFERFMQTQIKEELSRTMQCS